MKKTRGRPPGKATEKKESWKAPEEKPAAPSTETPAGDAGAENEPEKTGLPQKDLFRIDEVAKYFGVSDRCIRMWIDHHHFEIEKLSGTVRITRQSILNFRLKSKV